MASEGTWQVLPRPGRVYLQALGAPEVVYVCEHDIDYRDFGPPSPPPWLS